MSGGRAARKAKELPRRTGADPQRPPAGLVNNNLSFVDRPGNRAVNNNSNFVDGKTSVAANS